MAKKIFGGPFWLFLFSKIPEENSRKKYKKFSK
jgi:hypothetical protein